MSDALTQAARRQARGRKAAVRGAALAIVLAALAGCGMSGEDSAAGSATPPPLAAAQGGRAEQGGESAAGASAKELGTSEPTRVSIPALQVSSTLERLGKDAKGAMQTPRDPDKAGWYTPGPTPGATGPAVIAGHVTWNGAKAVFFKLSTLKRGDRIEVERKDGRTAVFTVDKLEQYPKDDFPTLKVYGNVKHAALRLITCGGEFSQAKHHYADNVVVYASLADTKG